MTEEQDVEAKRIKKLKMRSMRRGIKEMDIILSDFANVALDSMDTEALDLYEQLLEENDQDLYQWVSGQAAPKEIYDTLINQVKSQINDKY